MTRSERPSLSAPSGFLSAPPRSGGDRPARASGRRAYAAPDLIPLGTIASSTAGPDGAKTLDGLVGDDGGFVLRDDTTS